MMGLSIQRVGSQALGVPLQQARSSPVEASPPSKKESSNTVRGKLAWGVGTLAALALAPRLLLHLLPKSIWQRIEENTLYVGSKDFCVSKDVQRLADEFLSLQKQFPHLESHQIPLENNQSTRAWFHPAKDGKPTFLVSHGNAQSLESMADYEGFMKHGYGVVAYEYPGFGTTQGTATQASLITAGQGVSRFLVNKKKVPTTEQVLVGHSLGSNVSVHLAKEGPYKALILHSPMNNFADLIRKKIGILAGWLPVQNHALSPWNNDQILATLNTPLFVTAFVEDPVIPSVLSEKLYAVAKSSQKQWYSLNGQGHLMDPYRSHKEIIAFLNDLSPSKYHTPS
ncbi:MAG: alpha/beta hydrolase [Vampirovibrio sp.]